METHRIADRLEPLARESRWKELLSQLEGVPGPHRLASSTLSYRYGEALYHLGLLDRLAGHGAAFEGAARARSDMAGVMGALNLRGIAAFELGRTDEAGRSFEALLDLAEAEGDHDMLARASLNLGALANLLGRPEEALALYQLALPLFQRLRQTRGLAQTHQSLGMSYRDLRRFDDAEDAYREAERLGLGFGYTPILAMAVVGRAELYAFRGDAETAVSLADWGLQLSRKLSDPNSQGTALRVRGVARMIQARLTESVADLEQALDLARTTGYLLLEAESLRDLARLARARGDTDGASMLFAEAREAFDRLGALQLAYDMERELEDLDPDPAA